MMSMAEELDTLREENRQLRQALVSYDGKLPLEWKLCRGERKILTCLLSSPDGFRSHDALLTAATTRGEGNLESLRVFVVRLRKKLAHIGVEIRGIYGSGYELPKASRIKLQEAINATL